MRTLLALLVLALPASAQMGAMASPSAIAWPSFSLLSQAGDSATYAISWGSANNTVFYQLRISAEDSAMEDGWHIHREIDHPQTADTVTVALLVGGAEMRVCVRGVNTRDHESFRFGPERCVIEPLPDLLLEPGDPGAPIVEPVIVPGEDGAWLIHGIYGEAVDSVSLTHRVADVWQTTDERRPVAWMDGEPWGCTEDFGWPYPPQGIERGWRPLYLNPYGAPVRFDLLTRDADERYRADPECRIQVAG